MEYKLVAIDLDDTLLGNDLKISEKNKEFLQKAIDKGLLVTIATGRMFCSAQPFVTELNLNVPVITYQGALIKNSVTGETLLEWLLPMKYAQKIVEFCKKEDLHLQAFIEDSYYYNEENKYSCYYHEHSGIKGYPIGDLGKFLKKEPVKMIIINEPERINKLKDIFNEMLGGEVQITISKPSYLEFTHIEATKGKAIEHLCSMYDIEKSEVIAIGDSYNDISMIEYAGLGVAMDNSPDIVKSVADFVTKSNDEDGVAFVIDKFLFGGGISE